MASEPPPLDDVNLEPQLEQAYAQEEEVSPFTDPESPQEEELPPIPKEEEEEEEEEEEVHSKPEEDGLQPSPSPPLQPVPLLEQEDAPTLEPRAADDTEEPVVKQKPASAAPPEREPAKPSAGARSLDLFDEDEVAPRAEEEHRHHEVRAVRSYTLPPCLLPNPSTTSSSCSRWTRKRETCLRWPSLWLSQSAVGTGWAHTSPTPSAPRRQCPLSTTLRTWCAAVSLTSLACTSGLRSAMHPRAVWCLPPLTRTLSAPPK